MSRLFRFIIATCGKLWVASRFMDIRWQRNNVLARSSAIGKNFAVMIEQNPRETCDVVEEVIIREDDEGSCDGSCLFLDVNRRLNKLCRCQQGLLPFGQGRKVCLKGCTVRYGCMDVRIYDLILCNRCLDWW